MSFNINEIRANLAQGGARPNLFQVTITNPVNPIGDLKLPFLCQAAQLPATTITPINIPYFGRQIKIAGNRTFDPWTVNIMNDEDFLVKNAMESWVNAINSLQGNINTLGASPTLYKSQATVHSIQKQVNQLEHISLMASSQQLLAQLDFHGTTITLLKLLMLPSNMIILRYS